MRHSNGETAGRIRVISALRATVLVALGGAGPIGFASAARADAESDAATSAHNRVVMMQRFIVSASRVEKNPWRYASIPGFEVLTRASDEETDWEIDALRRGRWLQDDVIPKDWRPASPLPYTVIVDDTDMATVPTGQVHSQPVVFRTPEDALTWGQLSERINISIDPIGAYDGDTFAINSNLHGVDTKEPAYGTISLERLLRCAPPLPRWVIEGLIGQNSGIFRESFALFPEGELGGFEALHGQWIRKAQGPGTLWVSLEETQRLLRLFKKDKKAKIAVPPLGGLFAEAPPSDEGLPLWESEAGLFVRWGLMGPGHDDPVLSHAFLELVRRARAEPVTEKVFTECFGFGFAAMEERLGAFLKIVLASPTSVALEMPVEFTEPKLKAATADQIGRILGDWMRMQADAIRGADPELSQDFLSAAGRMLLRAYRDDNGLPPDVDPTREGGQSDIPVQNAAYGSAVVMKPFVVAASHLHDPALLAVYGLYEHDSGNVGKAREFLEAAAAAGAVRPRAYIVLAKLRYLEAIAIPSGAEGKLSAQQAASVLSPLRAALQYPADSDAYRLIVETCIHSEARPSEDDIAKVVDGVTLFPRDAGLAYRSAFLCATSGYAAQAAGLIDRGLIFASHESNREYLEELRSTLPGPAAAGTR